MIRHTGEDLIDEESIAIASVLAFQAACINGIELDTPETDCLSADGDASFNEEILDITVAVSPRLRLNL